ncbi:MAG: type I secretion system permease/ATPase [Pseudomonadota bacterium]
MKTKRVFDGQRSLIGSIFVASLFVNVLVLTAPLYMLQLFSRVLSSGSMSTLIALTIGAAIALFFFFLFDVLRQRLVARLGTRLEARLGPIVMSGIMSGNMPPETHGTQPLHDVQSLRSFVTSPILIALLDAPWSLVFVGLIFLFHPLLGLVALTGMIVLFMLGVINEFIGRGPNAAASDAASEATQSADEIFNNAEIIHAMGNTRTQVERWTLKSFSSMMFGTVATDRIATLSSLAKLVRMAMQVGIMGVGVVLVLNGQLSPGLMIAASILMGRAASPVEQSVAGWRGLLQVRINIRRLNAVLAHVQDADDRLELPEPEGRLSVETASAVIDGVQRPLFFDVNFELQPGQSLGLIGPSGAGKTSLARALVGLQPLVRGYIRIDDVALTDWSAEQIGSHIGFLPQRIELFRGTIAENIALMNPEARPSDVVAAAKLAEVHDMIVKLPGGYNAQVGDRGNFLSAGQRQRIGLARAFFGNRKLIVLDEPNANLDPEGEAALARAIANATARGSIVVVVTHRMNLLRQVSHAGVMEDGRLVRFGEAKGVVEAATRPIAQESAEEDPKVAIFRRHEQSGEQTGTPPRRAQAVEGEGT